MAAIDRIKYDAQSDEWLVWKYPSETIRIGSELIVNQSQEALLFKGGEFIHLFGPGSHTITSGNIPFLDRLIRLPFGGRTPFPAEVWFVNRTAKRDLRWGTRTPIPLLDPVLKVPVGVRAYGHWGLRVEDAKLLVTRLVGTLTDCRSDRIQGYFQGEVIQTFTNTVAAFITGRGISIFEANSRLDELSDLAARAMRDEFGAFGLEVVNFNIEQINLPEVEQQRLREILRKKMEIREISATDAGKAYTTMRTFDLLEKTAENEGGTAGGLLAGGLGLGVGLGAGVPVGKTMGESASAASAEGPDDLTRKLKALKDALEQGLISQEDYDAKKAGLLKDF